jgi:hypothetical protein
VGNGKVISTFAATAVISIACNCCGRSGIWGEPDASGDDVVHEAFDVSVETDAPRDAHDERDIVSLPPGGFWTVWGSSPYDVYVLGGNFPMRSAVHFDGTSWSFVDEDHVDPHADFWGATMNDSGGSSSRDVLVVGDSASPPMLPGPPNEYAWRYDGENWTCCLIIDPIDFEDPLYVVQELRGVWSISRSSVWAVGWGLHEEIIFAGAIVHFDGARWSLREYGRFPRLESIWGVSDNEMFAVGHEGTIVRLVDGAWEAMESPVDDDLHGIWGRSTVDIFAVGGAGTIIHFNGDVWTVVDDDETIWPLYSVWGTLDGPIHAVGMNGAIVTLHGETWETSVDGMHADFYDVWGSAADDVYAVGGRHEDPMPHSVGVIVHFDGTTWRRVEDLPSWP